MTGLWLAARAILSAVLPAIQAMGIGGLGKREDFCVCMCVCGCACVYVVCVCVCVCMCE